MENHRSLFIKKKAQIADIINGNCVLSGMEAGRDNFIESGDAR